MRQEITIFSSTLKRFKVQEGYELRPSGRFASLQKKLWNWAVGRGLIVPHFEDHEKVTRIVVNGDDLFDRIFNQYQGILLSMRDPEVVIMGPDTFRKLMSRPPGEHYGDNPFSLRANGMIKRYRDQRGEMFNLPVRVIPHMEGCLILDRA